MLLLSTLALFVACRAAIGAISAVDGSNPGRRSLAHWLPVVTTALAAILLHHGEIAVAIIFGTSVAYLSLVMGMTTYVAPMHGVPQKSRAWAFILPAALLSLVAGFGGVLTWLHAAMLLVLGLAIFGVWREKSPALDMTAQPADDLQTEQKPEPNWQAPVQLVLAVLLAGIGGWVAVQATITTASHAAAAGTPFIAVTVLSPMLILPTLRTSTLLAQRGHADEAAAALVATVLLNLCVLLPVVVLLWYPVSAISQLASATTPVSFHDLDLAKIAPLPYPIGVWRLETVVLVMLSFVLLPVALGRWALARQESILLIAAYVIYLASVVLTLKAG